MSELGHSEHGDGDAVVGNEILTTEVGSGLHGIAIEGTDDHDEMGVFIEPPEHVMGLKRPVESWVWRTQPEGHRSGHGDTDLVFYSLRKFCALAAKGNPSVILPLWAPEEKVYTQTDLGKELRELRSAFLSVENLKRCLGFLDAQLKQLSGETRQRNHRPELIARYGYDVKTASHALRLGYQGREIGEHARLTLPMPNGERESVHAMKAGAYSFEEALVRIETVRSCLELLIDGGAPTPLPDRADVERISTWMADAHQRHWNEAKTTCPTCGDQMPTKDILAGATLWQQVQDTHYDEALGHAVLAREWQCSNCAPDAHSSIHGSRTCDSAQG